VPILLISLSLIFLFAWELKNISQQREALQTSRQKLDDYAQGNMPRLDDQVQKAKQVQAGLEKLVMDLLDVAKTDPEAKAIVDKYKIQQQAPPAGATAPAP